MLSLLKFHFTLFQSVDYQPAAELGLKPGGSGSHDITCGGNINKLLHGNMLKFKSHFHLTAVYPLFKLT